MVELALQSIECREDAAYCEAVYRKMLRGGKKEVVIVFPHVEGVTPKEHLNALTEYITGSTVKE